MMRLLTASALLLALGSGAAGAADSTSTGGEAAKPAAGAPAATPAPATAPTSSDPSGAAASAAPAAAAAPAGEVAVLQTVMGTIVIKFHEKDAPKTVANFKKLAKEKFYDGTYFHRVITGFMIQGGDPNTKNADPSDDGVGGPGYTVPAEIKLPHLRGSVATARQGDQVNPSKASSGSQFFICVAPLPSLDRGGYTVFGEVISGMDAVDKIVALANDPATPKGAAGPNPGKKALVTKVTLEPLAKWQKPTAVK